MRLIALLVAVAATWLGIPQIDRAVAAQGTSAATFTDDDCGRAVAAADLTTERGPLTTGDHHTRDDGVHRCSRGPSACQQPALVWNASTYHSDVRVVEVDSGGGTTQDPTGGFWGELLLISCAPVAANAGARALVDASKYDYLFGRVASGSHNAARSAQQLAQPE